MRKTRVFRASAFVIFLTVLLLPGISAAHVKASDTQEAEPPQQSEPVQQPSQAPEASKTQHPAPKGQHIIPQGSNVYIDSMDGFETPLAAALTKKKVPLVVVTDITQAQYEITGSTEKKKHSTGLKIAAIALGGAMGAAATADQMTGSIQVIDLHSSAIVYAYTATKGDRPQSVAEACAKHIKDEAIAR